MSTNSKGFVNLLFLTIILLIILGGIGYWAYKSGWIGATVFHQTSCGTTNAVCKGKEQCIGYIGSDGKRYSTCAILCPNGDRDCPTDTKCGKVPDGPQNVCF